MSSLLSFQKIRLHFILFAREPHMQCKGKRLVAKRQAPRMIDDRESCHLPRGPVPELKQIIMDTHISEKEHESIPQESRLFLINLDPFPTKARQWINLLEVRSSSVEERSVSQYCMTCLSTASQLINRASNEGTKACRGT